MTLLQQANQALRAEHWPQAALAYWQAAQAEPRLWPCIEHNLHWVKARWLKERLTSLKAGAQPRIAVSCWELAHNPAGRSMTLLEAWQPLVSQVEMLGCIFPSYGERLWAPLQNMNFPCHYFLVHDEQEFIKQAVELVMQHPYDLVHISKPRLPSLVFAKLYQLIWGAQIILDIDDEELGFTQEATLNTQQPSRWKDLRKTAWTHWAVSQIPQFSQRTVSNPALQNRYGGELLPHMRPAQRYQVSQQMRLAARKQWDIPVDAKVVLFAGTPRKHKGLMQTAQALVEAKDPKAWLVIMGDFPKSTAQLKNDLQNLEGLNCRFLPGQPYDQIAPILALGDITLLLQDSQSLVAQYQLPAKLMDALASGLRVLATATPAIQHLIDAGVVTQVSEANLKEALNTALNTLGSSQANAQAQQNRDYFQQHLSVEARQPQLQDLLVKCLTPQSNPQTPPAWTGQLHHLIQDPYHFLIPRHP